MSTNLLRNGGFEADWSNESSHRCLIFPADGEPYESERGNIFTPPGWTTWFRHDPGTWDQPEVRDAWASSSPERVHSGQKAILAERIFRAALRDRSIPAKTRLAAGVAAFEELNRAAEAFEKLCIHKLDQHFDFVHEPVFAHDNLVVRTDMLDSKQHAFDL